MINIIITSDIRIYCEGLAGILARTHDVNIAGVANNYEDAISAISANSADVLLLDMTMDRSCNLAGHISRTNPHIKIVALAVSYDESNIMLCAEAGVTCYVPREASVNELIEAIKEAAKGECYCPPKIAACILKKVQGLTLSARNKYLSSSTRGSPLPSAESSGRQACLTPRECQIADLLSEGLSNKQIARDLSIEVSTVKNHVHNLLVKLEVKNRGQAVFSLRNKLPYAESFDLDPYLHIPS